MFKAYTQSLKTKWAGRQCEVKLHSRALVSAVDFPPARLLEKNTNLISCAHRVLSSFDPAVQRFIAMRASQYDYFKATPKTAAYGMGLFIIPLFGTFYIVCKERAERERAYRAGEVKYTERAFKFI